MERRCYHEHPPRHEYLLTAKGRDLRRVMVSLLQWGDTWSDLDPPPITLVDLDTDEPIEAAHVDLRTGRPLSELRVGRRFNT